MNQTLNTNLSSSYFDETEIVEKIRSAIIPDKVEMIKDNVFIIHQGVKTPLYDPKDLDDHAKKVVNKIPLDNGDIPNRRHI